MENKKEWFAQWFDSPLYHKLYNHRDEHEARDFIHAVFHHISIPKGAKVLDMACGKGRHSRVMAQLGFQVIGFDLSEHSIEEANAFHTPGAEFYVHDMRNPLPWKHFQACLNLFTSFGYFDEPSENVHSLKNIYHALAPGGWFLQDYINAEIITCNLPFEGVEMRGDLEFHIKKEWKDKNRWRLCKH